MKFLCQEERNLESEQAKKRKSSALTFSLKSRSFIQTMRYQGCIDLNYIKEEKKIFQNQISVHDLFCFRSNRFKVPKINQSL